MTVKKPSRIRRFLRFIAFRLIPTLLIVAIIYFSYGVALAVVRRVNEQQQATNRLPLYQATAVAIQPTLVTFTPSPTATQTATQTATATLTASQTATPTASATATQTATATLTATNSPTLTATNTATSTSIPSLTPEPTQIAQVFMTNTPRALVITIPAPNTDVPSETPLPTPTSIPSATFTPEPTATLTFTALPPATETPRPLPTLLFPSAPEGDVAAPTAIPTQVPTIDRQGYDLVNIMLMASDSELTGDNFDRTDTMIIVSINRTTNTVSMLSLPRDLFVYIPGWTMQRLNLAYTRGESVGWTDGGFGLMRQTIFYNFGINVHYFVLVNLSGFKTIIDSLGGVNVAVDCAIQDLPLIGAPPPPEAVGPDADGYYILPVGFYQMAGESALWYARSRHSSSDFDRGRRQMQILRALWRQARSNGDITRLPDLWSQLTSVVKTNMTFEDMVGLVPYALNLDPDRLEQFNMRRLYHTTPWQPPDGSFVQLPNYEPIHQLMMDFYQPPTDSQAIISRPSVAVFNGTTNANWDRVAADSLAREGFVATGAGQADNSQYNDTILIDYTGQTKGSSLEDIASLINVKPENIRIEPDPNRTVDFGVILGSNYNSCNEPGVLAVTTPTPGS